ncbi:class I SAM-dependent methyltransferase [Sphingomonas lenta]|uniref:SAM-dependent methyltransferase n=1 Tax=Sphingomonas lenta TaxID=1141887 RepID=A0A2A2SJ08_9SPHN|nr:class I SAM-dependent methyltransferase [Sphingomonas lenta]PAX09226.1 SAM-dependent methyltransferase [Sphingomonas lenta]
MNPVLSVFDFVRRLVNGDRRRGEAGWKANDAFVHQAPSAQQAVDIFKGDWASKLPIEGVTSGAVDLFDDTRIRWLLERLGDVGGWNVLELGPLEGGHTSMLTQAGAASILAIEANKAAFLRCLLVKELLGLLRAHFELGDFDAFLAQSDRRYDLLMASGILYHMVDPLQTLLNMVKASDRIFVWSHFVDKAAMLPGDRRWRPMTGEVTSRTLGDDTMTYYVRSYRGTEAKSDFCGGVMSRSIWLDKDEVLAFFQRHGYAVETAFEEPQAVAGPSVCMLARRA